MRDTIQRPQLESGLTAEPHRPADMKVGNIYLSFPAFRVWTVLVPRQKLPEASGTAGLERTSQGASASLIIRFQIPPREREFRGFRVSRALSPQGLLYDFEKILRPSGKFLAQKE